jgi:hypothetical protein
MGVRMTSFWTPADQAELDILLYALTSAYNVHRRTCEACSPEACAELEAWTSHKADCRACGGDAPLSYPRTDECRRRHRVFVAHGDACPRCNPCQHLQAAIGEVLVWREVRMLLSHAEALRAAENEVAP